jgi:hypothetical protein
MQALRQKLRGAVLQGTALAVVSLAACTQSCSSDDDREDATGGSSTGGRSETGGRTEAGGTTGGTTGGRSGSGGRAIGEGGEAGAPNAEGGSVATGGASGGEGGSQAGAAGAVSSDEYPLDLLGCKGPEHEGGYYGQCCFRALCYESTSCLPSDATELRNALENFPPGSGSCACGVAPQPTVSGPFAPNPADPELPDGNCCYVVGGISCEGRPLMIQGVPRVAPVVARRDWGVAV